MRIALVFLLIVGFTVGEVPWKQNQEYVYGIYSRTLTALPDLKEQYVGVITKGQLVLQVKNDKRIVGKLINCVYAHVHDVLENGIDTQIPEDQLTYQEYELNNKPFELEVLNGYIKEIFVDETITNDQLNQLKAIISQLQIDVNGQNLIQSKHTQCPTKEERPQGYFKVMEPTVTGMCETIYNVKPLYHFQTSQILPPWIHYRNVDTIVVPQQQWQQPQWQQQWQQPQQQQWQQPQQQQWQQPPQQQWQQPQQKQWQQTQPQEQQWQKPQPQQQWQQPQQQWQQPQPQPQKQQWQEPQPQPQQQQWQQWKQLQQQQQPLQGQQWQRQSSESEESVEQKYQPIESVQQMKVQKDEVWGQNLFEIVKTINYDNCVHLKGYHYGIRSGVGLKPLGNKVGEFLSKSTITKIIASGTWYNFVIQDVVTTNRISVSPDLYQKQKAQVTSQIQLKLLKVHEITTMLEEPKQMINVGSLVYTYNLPSDKTNHIRLQNIENVNQMENTWMTRNVQEEQQVPLSSEEYVHENVQFMEHQPKPNLQLAPEIPFYHFNVGNKGRGINVDTNINVEIEVRKLITEIAQDVLVQDEITKRNTLEKFDILCDLIRVMSQQQIININKQLGITEITEIEQNLVNVIERKVYHDAVAQAGTGPSVSAICKWIVERQVKGIQARGLIQDTCRHIQTPTEEIVRTIFNLVKNEEIIKRHQLHSTVVLALTDLLRHAQVNIKDEHNRFPVYVFGEFHTQLKHIVVNELIPYLAQRLQNSLDAKDDQNVLLYLRALGNLAHPEILDVYNKCLESGAKLTNFQRTALVLSLDKFVKIYPNLARQILFKIYSNVAETPETRSIAVVLLMHCHPTLEMLQVLAQSTHDDPSYAVRSIVKSAIVTCSNLKSKQWKNLSENCRSVKKFLTTYNFGDQYSKTYLRDYVANEMNLIYNHQLTHIVGKDSIIPHITNFVAYENLGGFRSRIAEVQAMVSTVDEFTKILPTCNRNFCQRQTTYYRQDQVPENQNVNVKENVKQQQEQQFTPKWNIDEIAKQLNIEPEIARRLEGQFLFNVLGRKEFYSFDEKLLKKLPQILISSFSLFKEGQKLNYNKMYMNRQVVIAFPLATGYPFIYTLRQPHLLQAIGQIQVKTLPDIVQQPSLETIKNMENVNINCNVHLVYSTNQISKTGFITPFDRQRYVAGHVRKVHTHIPISLKLDVNVRNGDINMKLAPIDGKKDFYLLQSGAWPFTLYKDVFDIRPAAEAKHLKVIQTRQTQIYDRVLGEKTTGMAWHVQLEHQFKGQHQVNVEKALWQQGILTLTNLPLSYHYLFQKVIHDKRQSFWSLIPFTFQQKQNGNFLNKVVSNLISVPLADELNLNTYVKSQGLWSFVTLPFADKTVLEEAVKDESVLTLGGWPWPINTLDHYSYNLKYDAARTVNQILKFSLKTEVLHNVNEMIRSVSNRVQGPASVDEEKLAYPTVLTPDSEQRRLQFLQNAATGIKQASVAVVDASIVFDGQSKAEYVVTLAHGESLVDEKDRLLVFLSTNAVKKSENKQICVSYMGKFPNGPVLNFEQALKQETKSNSRVQIAYGDNCQTTKTHIQADIKFEQTPEYKQMVRNSQVGRRCLVEMKEGNKQLGGCIDAIYQANLFDAMTINVDLVNPTRTINQVVRGCLNTIRRVAIWNLQHESVNEVIDNNKIMAVLKFKPIMNNEDKEFDKKHIGMDNVDILLDSGSVKQVFTNVHINHILTPILSVNRNLNAANRVVRGNLVNGNICTIDQNKIFTFDNNVVKHQIGKCWHVVAQYTKLQSRLDKLDFINEAIHQKDVSILIRQNPVVNQKELLVLCKSTEQIDHVVHLIPTGTTIQVKVDGQLQTIVPNQIIEVFGKQQDKKLEQPLIRIQNRFENECEILVRGKQIKIYFDGINVRVHANPSLYHGKIQGLCGSFTGERVWDLVTPNKCVVKDNMLFTSSWILDSPTCESNVQQLRTKLNQMKCEKVKYTINNIGHYWNTPQVIHEEGKWIQQKYWPISDVKNVNVGITQRYIPQEGVIHKTQHDLNFGFGYNYGPQGVENLNVHKKYEEFKPMPISVERDQSKQQSSEELRTQQKYEQVVGKSYEQEDYSSEEQRQWNKNYQTILPTENVQKELKSVKQNECVLNHRVQFVKDTAGKICFTKHLLNSCPSGCKELQLKEIEVGVHCRDPTDVITKLWLQQIHNGENPDLTSKVITKTITLNVPLVCVH